MHTRRTHYVYQLKPLQTRFVFSVTTLTTNLKNRLTLQIDKTSPATIAEIDPILNICVCTSQYVHAPFNTEKTFRTLNKKLKL